MTSSASTILSLDCVNTFYSNLIVWSSSNRTGSIGDAATGQVVHSIQVCVAGGRATVEQHIHPERSQQARAERCSPQFIRIPYDLARTYVPLQPPHSPMMSLCNHHMHH